MNSTHQNLIITAGFAGAMILALLLSVGIKSCENQAPLAQTDTTVTTQEYVDSALTCKIAGLVIHQILVGNQIAMIKFTNKTAIFLTNNDTTGQMYEYFDANGCIIRDVTIQERVWTDQYQRVFQREAKRVVLNFRRSYNAQGQPINAQAVIFDGCKKVIPRN